MARYSILLAILLLQQATVFGSAVIGCNDASTASTCYINCTNPQSCKDTTLQCSFTNNTAIKTQNPTANKFKFCNITCNETESCKNALISITDAIAATITCANGTSACANLTIDATSSNNDDILLYCLPNTQTYNNNNKLNTYTSTSTNKICQNVTIESGFGDDFSVYCYQNITYGELKQLKMETGSGDGDDSRMQAGGKKQRLNFENEYEYEYGIGSDVDTTDGICENFVLNASIGEHYHFECDGKYSCRNAVIYSPKSEYLQCRGNFACFNVTMYALYGIDNPHSNDYFNCDANDKTVCHGAVAYCNPGYTNDCQLVYIFNRTTSVGQWKCQGVCGWG